MRRTLIAKDGFVYTNGTEYGKVIYPADGVDEAEYYQITEAEYEKIKRQMEEKNS